MSEATEKLALGILALVDEHPSEPFSYERKQLESQISDMVIQYSEEIDNERDAAYDLGFDEGFYEGKEEAAGEYEDRISELEEEVDDLRRELSDTQLNLDQAFAEGYETASKGAGNFENLNFS